MTTVVPIIDQNRGWREWYKGEIFIGPNGPAKAKYVPNVDDKVWDWGLGTYRVSDVDYTTGLSTLQPYTANGTNGVNATDILLGTGPGQLSESYRLYVNTSVVPHQCAFDSRLRINGSSAAYIKIFSEANISSTGHVISGVFNPSGVQTSENIPLELIIMPGVTNVAVRTPAVANLTDTVADGDAVTVVVYSASGAVLSICRVLVALTNFIRTIDQSKRIITGISLVTPYLSPSNASLIRLPLNMMLQSVPLQGRVQYNDGTRLTLPVDGTKFTLFGMTNYTASRQGQVNPLVLSYSMAADEYSYNSTGPNPTRTINVEYAITSIAPVGIYTVQLYAIPTWTTATSKWRLEYYLYNLDRQQVFLVTPFVTTAALGTPFNGSTYGSTQEIAVGINLQDIVGGGFSFYRLVQNFKVKLTGPVNQTAALNYWTITYSGTTVYGNGLRAVRDTDPLHPGKFLVALANGYTTVNTWLANFYTPLFPLIDTESEVAAPAPTHVNVSLPGVWQRDIPIANVLQVVDNLAANPALGATLLLSFFHRSAGNPDLQLCAGPVSVTDI